MKALNRGFWAAACLLAACASTKWPYDTEAFRFTEAEPSALLVFMPKQVRLAAANQTLAGAGEVNIETRFAPIDLSEIAAAWGAPLVRTLQNYRNAPIAVYGPAEPWVTTLADDPRRAGDRGYRLLPPFDDAPPPRDRIALPPPSEKSLDGWRAPRCLIRAEIVADNAPRPQWHAFAPKEIAKKFHVRQMLLVGFESITVDDRDVRPRATGRLGAHLVDLDRPLLAASFFVDVDLSDAAGPAGVEAALCQSLPALQADGWKALRASLPRLGERAGHLLALKFGWINDRRLAEEAAVWKKENADRLTLMFSEQTVERPADSGGN